MKTPQRLLVILGQRNQETEIKFKRVIKIKILLEMELPLQLQLQLQLLLVPLYAQPLIQQTTLHAKIGE